MVGATSSMRVTSVTLPSCIGTLRSTRTSTRLPFTSASSRLRKLMGGELALSSGELPHRYGRVDHAVGEAPLVVIPRHHANERAVHHLGLIHVENRRVRIVIEIARDVGGFGEAENTLELLAGGAFDRGVDLVL